MLKNTQLRSLAIAGVSVLALSLGGAAMAGQMPSTIEMLPSNADAGDVRSKLQGLGFAEVQDVKHSGNIYTAHAKWNGNWVNLAIDSRHGGISKISSGGDVINMTGNVTDAGIRQQMQNLGYRSVGSISRSGDVIETTAIRNGQLVHVSIDAVTGDLQHREGEAAAIAMPKPGMDMAYLEKQLRPLGYTNVRNVERSGDVYKVEAEKAGTWMRLSIDGANGKVSSVN